MSRHRAVPPPARRTPVKRHRATEVRPRYGRLAVAGTSLAVTLIALLGGVGILPSIATGSESDAGRPLSTHSSTHSSAHSSTPSVTPSVTPGSTPSAAATVSFAPPSQSASASATAASTPVPARSGDGRRIVFSQAEQRVWLVDADDRVQRTYLVSGSTLDNLDPGSYHVYSTSRWAVGVEDSGVMQYFVRFTQGPTGAAIGFHSIPTHDGEALQSRRQLGTPQSHGCIRQYLPDAIALWDFAPVGTEVDVVAT